MVVKGYQSKYHKTDLDLYIEWKQVFDENQERKSKLSAERILFIFKAISNQVSYILRMDPRYTRAD